MHQKTSKTLLSSVFEKTIKYMEQMPKIRRKPYGQFFTSVETAQYMASMFSPPQKENLSILDPGSGSGILTAALLSCNTYRRKRTDCNLH